MTARVAAREAGSAGAILSGAHGGDNLFYKESAPCFLWCGDRGVREAS